MPCRYTVELLFAGLRTKGLSDLAVTPQEEFVMDRTPAFPVRRVMPLFFREGDPKEGRDLPDGLIWEVLRTGEMVLLVAHRPPGPASCLVGFGSLLIRERRGSEEVR